MIMKPSPCLSERQKAHDAGFTASFSFDDGGIRCHVNNKMYPFRSCLQASSICWIAREIVYRIETSDGVKGIAVIDFERPEEED
jgi:hypothetical protein